MDTIKRQNRVRMAVGCRSKSVCTA